MRYIVNDFMTCIPGTKTLWNDLLENLDGFKALTFETTNSKNMDDFRKNLKKIIKKDDIVIQNATYLGYCGGKVISYLQDNARLMYGNIYPDIIKSQLDTLNNSKICVCNSIQIKDSYSDFKFKIIPIGIDSDLFQCRIKGNPKIGIFIGDSSTIKGWDIFLQIIENMQDYKWLAVLKHDYKNDSIKNLKIYNNLNHKQLIRAASRAGFMIHTSRFETQCLAAIECGFMNKPVVISKVGVFSDWIGEEPGVIVKDYNVNNFIGAIKNIDYKKDIRSLMFNSGLDKMSRIIEWKKLVNELEGV